MQVNPMTTSDFQYTVSRDEVTGVYKGTLGHPAASNLRDSLQGR